MLWKYQEVEEDVSLHAAESLIKIVKRQESTLTSLRLFENQDWPDLILY